MTAPDQAFYDFEFTHSKTGHPHIYYVKSSPTSFESRRSRKSRLTAAMSPLYRIAGSQLKSASGNEVLCRASKSNVLVQMR